MGLDFIDGTRQEKVLQLFPVTQFISGEVIQKFWHDFYSLYMILRKPALTNSEINNFEIKVKRMDLFICRPNQVQINSSLQIPGLYRKEDVTHMHVFSKHIINKRDSREFRNIYHNIKTHKICKAMFVLF